MRTRRHRAERFWVSRRVLLGQVQEPSPGLPGRGASAVGRSPLSPQPLLGPFPHFILLIKFFPNWIILGFLACRTFIFFLALFSMWVLERGLLSGVQSLPLGQRVLWKDYVGRPERRVTQAQIPRTLHSKPRHPAVQALRQFKWS